VNPVDPFDAPSQDDRREWGRYLRYWVPQLSLREEREYRRVLKTDHGLLEGATDHLLAHFIVSELRRHPWKQRKERGRGWGDWSVEVLLVNVDIRPNGRAVLRQDATTYRVDMLWNETARDEHGKPSLGLKRVEIVADDTMEPLRMPDLGVYVAAFFLRAMQGRHRAFARAPRIRPEPGRALKYNFYRHLLDLEEQLKMQRYANPAAEIARRMDANPATVRSWLHRGRQYVKREGGN
jgi:hypothetical protein